MTATHELSAGLGMVHLIIDYSNGVQKNFSAIPWQAGMDILAAMEAAKSIPQD
jgi:hypothetical protein